MATTSERKHENVRLESTGNYDDLGTASFNAFTQASQVYAEGMMALGEEMRDFVSNRLRHDMEFSESLTKCETMSDVASAQKDWWHEAREDYLDEAQRIAELGAKLFQSGLPESQK